MCPAPLATCADGVLLALESMVSPGCFGTLHGGQLLSERAQIRDLKRNGHVSPGGACRLLETVDGALAVNLAREEDWALLPAWLQAESVADWQQLSQLLKGQNTQHLVDRARLMGLAVSADSPVRKTPVPWFSEMVTGKPRVGSSPLNPRVVDLSSLWAGPLCSRLLQMMGAEVIKVEAAQRPDGARRGSTEFFARLNAGKQELSLDLHTPKGVQALRDLIKSADIVIEASRPRALRQLGIDAEALVTAQPGLTWVSVTGYGRAQPQADWVAFGDDAAVAAGLSALMFTATGERLIVGDAIADPLTGMHAALAAWSRHKRGTGGLLSLAMYDVVTHCVQHNSPKSDNRIRARFEAWMQLATTEKEAA